ncbi:MAG: hypothetical protein HC802_14295 [Caldilineaceae bacterium]|nr:hypothetical protein [Caldilineaceae bacterium]
MTEILREALCGSDDPGASTRHTDAPAEIREKYGIQPGDTFRLVDLEGIMVLTPMAPMAPELAREIERLREDAGLSIEELLDGLREQRERYYQERNAADQSE